MRALVEKMYVLGWPKSYSQLYMKYQCICIRNNGAKRIPSNGEYIWQARHVPLNCIFKLVCTWTCHINNTPIRYIIFKHTNYIWGIFSCWFQNNSLPAIKILLIGNSDNVVKYFLLLEHLMYLLLLAHRL